MSSERRLRPVGRAGATHHLLVVATVLGISSGTLRTSTPTYLRDDPIQVDNDRVMDAGGALPIEGSNGYDFAEHTFLGPGDRRPLRAANVNTIGEVPDSSWFTSRIGRGAMSLEDLVRGPNTLSEVGIDGWPIVQEKSSGITPGYRITDPDGHMYQIKFDPPEHPEMSSGAEVIGAAIYHALGYNVVEGYIVEVDPDRIVISEQATTVDLSGRKRRMERRDVERLLAKAARQPNGKYRAMLSRFAEGEPLGHFKYYGTRPDDPNDIHPHEHRRELRGNRVFAAWLNHDDSRALNSLDMLQGPEGRQFIRHYMFDFGSIMGSGSTMAQVPRAGNEYILEWAPALKTLATLGLYVRPWIMVDYWQGAKSVGRFESTFFDPVKWKPEYPNPAFDNMQPEDAFWAAELVSRFSDEMIRAIVAKARYSEPRAAEHIAATLIERRDKVLRAWLTGVNPLIDPRLEAGVLAFRNAAVQAGLAAPARQYRVTWQTFDNATGQLRGQPTTLETTEPRATPPPALLQATDFVAASVETHHDRFAHWTRPVRFTFRRAADGWQLVGLDR